MIQRDYEILLIESDPAITDDIINSFNPLPLALSFAETKSLARASSLITSEKINFVIFGPSLSVPRISEFIQKHEVKYKIPSLYIYTEVDTAELETLLHEGVSDSISFPIKENEIGNILENVVASFKRKSILNLDQEKLLQSKVSKSRQLALILDRLSSRLLKVSDELKRVSNHSDLIDISIPEAVNKVILGATQFRKEKEQEDLDKLIRSLLSK